MIRVFDDEVIRQFSKYDPDSPSIKNAKIWDGVFFLLEPDIAMFPCIESGENMKMHAWARPEARGIKTVRACKDAIAWVFNHTKAIRITSKVSRERREVQAFAAMFLERSHEDGKYIYYELER